MRLHRTITADRPLLVVALEEEAAHLHVSDLPVLVTGAGKVNAAVALASTLGSASPSEVINLGTAGGLRPGITGTHLITTVTQHDLDDAALFALTGLHHNSVFKGLKVHVRRLRRQFQQSGTPELGALALAGAERLALSPLDC